MGSPKKHESLFYLMILETQTLWKEMFNFKYKIIFSNRVLNIYVNYPLSCVLGRAKILLWNRRFIDKKVFNTNFPNKHSDPKWPPTSRQLYQPPCVPEGVHTRKLEVEYSVAFALQ